MIFLSGHGWEFVKESHDSKELLKIYQKEGKYLCIGISNEWPFRGLELNNVPIKTVAGNPMVPADRMDPENLGRPIGHPGWGELYILREIVGLRNDNFNNYYNN